MCSSACTQGIGELEASGLGKEHLLAFGQEQGNAIAQYFAHEQPPGWFPGTIVHSAKSRQNKIWINYKDDGKLVEEEGQVYSKVDDIETITSCFTFDAYKVTWLLISDKVIWDDIDMR